MLVVLSPKIPKVQRPGKPLLEQRRHAVPLVGQDHVHTVAMNEPEPLQDRQ